ncbi:GroES-like protein [Hypoxylon cercidicola]|nr:GroES-like protein [Hypoxylon cercidicola]
MAITMKKTYQALVGDDIGGQYRLVNMEIPEAKSDTLLCKVAAIALNPADWKMVDFSVTDGSVGGNDFAGEVVQVGDGTNTTGRFKVGDRIFAMMFGLNPSDKTTGSFGEYALATADLACRIPDWMSYEEASTFGVAVGTCGGALYQALKLPMPNQPVRKPFYVLVSGGATATGTVAIQLLKESGLLPIATCSPSNSQMLKDLGAVTTFDYRSPTCGMEIRNFTNNELAHVLDCVTAAETMKMCYEAIGTGGGSYVALDPFATHIQYTRRDVVADWVMIYSLFGKPVNLKGVYGRPAMAVDRQFAKVWFALAERLVEEGRLKAHPIEVRSGGLTSIADGIEHLRKGQVKARKLVYPLA